VRAPVTVPIDTLILDYGGVVADHYCEPFHSELASLIGTTGGEVETLISETSLHGQAYRLAQISTQEFWTAVSREVKGVSFDANLAQDRWTKSYILNAAMLELMRYLKHERGLCIIIFSNMDVARFSYVRDLIKWFDFIKAFVVSCETGLLKPSAGAFEVVLNTAGRRAHPERVLFVDDREAQVTAAEALGMRAHRFVNVGELCQYLSRITLSSRTSSTT
jgi:putative hydrolase of the HAD superfamily